MCLHLSKCNIVGNLTSRLISHRKATNRAGTQAKTTSCQRQCDVMTSHRRRYDCIHVHAGIESHVCESYGYFWYPLKSTNLIISFK